ncbi:MAG: hypothetical protein M3350_06510 [Actinomycetota bacterium]|nr:hypothetical protein [Actinomycetota bacterium]
MKYRATLVGGALVAAMALPVTAEAHQSASPKTVAKHVRSADRALGIVETLVERNSDAKAAVRLAKMRRDLRAADRESATLRRRARSPRAKGRAASATVKVARQHNEAAEVLAVIVDEAGGRPQVDIAATIDSELRGREKAISVLTKLLNRLPESAKPGIARAIAQLSSDGLDEVSSLTEALQGATLSPQAREKVQDALERATRAIDTAIDRLSSVVGLVPEQARPYVEQAIGRVTEQLTMVKGILAGLFSGSPAPGGGASLPIPIGLPVPAGPQCNIPIRLPFSLPGC